MKEEKKKECACHCHQEKDLPEGVQCRCIKNCIHCRPENFNSKENSMEELFKKQDKERREHLEQEAVSFIVRCNTTQITEDGDSYTNALEILKEIYVVNAESAIDQIRQETLEAVYGEVVDLVQKNKYPYMVPETELRFINDLDDRLKSLDIKN